MEFDASKMEDFLEQKTDKAAALKFLADSLTKSGFERNYALRIVFNAYVVLNPENEKLYQKEASGN